MREYNYPAFNIYNFKHGTNWSKLYRAILLHFLTWGRVGVVKWVHLRENGEEKWYIMDLSFYNYVKSSWSFR